MVTYEGTLLTRWPLKKLYNRSCIRVGLSRRAPGHGPSRGYKTHRLGGKAGGCCSKTTLHRLPSHTLSLWPLWLGAVRRQLGLRVPRLILLDSASWFEHMFIFTVWQVKCWVHCNHIKSCCQISCKPRNIYQYEDSCLEPFIWYLRAIPFKN